MIILISITILYCLLALTGGCLIWSNKSIPLPSPFSKSVSVVVALRNEEKNINRLVEGLLGQKYPLLLQFIFVDDNSTDKTLDLLRNWALKDQRIKVLSTSDQGKKSCIAKAVRLASNPIVVQTDADCEMGNYWVLSSVNKLLSSNSDLVLGPVYPFQTKSVLNGLIRLEWLAMQFLTFLTALLKNPGMANGANLTFYKSDYEDFSASKYGELYASGDDMFFLRFLQKKGKKVCFNFDKEAIVRTEMPVFLKSLFQQRIRWASKAGKTTNTITWLFTLIVVLVNFSWIGAIFLVVENINYLFLFCFCVISKLLTDLFLCWNMVRLFNDYKVLCLLPLLFILYPIYLLTGVMLSFKKSYKWKGRRLY